LHRSRELLMRQRTMIVKAIRAHLAKLGIVAAQGPRKIVDLVRHPSEPGGLELSAFARSALLSLAAQLETLATEIGQTERMMTWLRQSSANQRLETIPGIGLITATALAASVPDPSVFPSSRQFAAWLGLVPEQNSSGGKEGLGRVSKMGNGYLRRLLVVGATSVTRLAPTSYTRTGAWAWSLLARKPWRLVTVAIANKTARTAWALLAKGARYRAASAV
jgi:transposase